MIISFSWGLHSTAATSTSCAQKPAGSAAGEELTELSPWCHRWSSGTRSHKSVRISWSKALLVWFFFFFFFRMLLNTQSFSLSPQAATNPAYSHAPTRRQAGVFPFKPFKSNTFCRCSGSSSKSLKAEGGRERTTHAQSGLFAGHNPYGKL